MNRRKPVLHTVIRKLVPALLGVIALSVLLLPSVPGSQSPGASDDTSNLQLTIMSKELLEGISVGGDAMVLHVQGDVRAPEGSNGDGVYQELFRIDSGAKDSIAPASELERIGIVPVGQTTYTRSDGTVAEYPFGLARIEFMGEMKEGRVIFGPEDVKPVLGVSALEAIGFTVDAATQTLKRLPAAE